MDVQHYELEVRGGRRAEADLCIDHSASLREFLNDHPRRPKRRRTVEITAIEDIKKKQPPKP